jgi:hypothetical protein
MMMIDLFTCLVLFFVLTQHADATAVSGTDALLRGIDQPNKSTRNTMNKFIKTVKRLAKMRKEGGTQPWNPKTQGAKVIADKAIAELNKKRALNGLSSVNGFEIISYEKQLVAGTNYFICGKIEGEDGKTGRHISLDWYVTLDLPVYSNCWIWYILYSNNSFVSFRLFLYSYDLLDLCAHQVM